ncbi:polysaccharide pyruvyl transferase family protein [Robertmurraya sp. P23]|uniref:polysaccharide pyruvyl transferase family protein n=1 Tax=Robertmurraya sp. P23 TaxID=3436931 RepID=UPI003D998440
MRVAIDAYFNNNLGDDLFLDLLLNRYKNVQFDFLVKDPESCQAFKDHPQVRFISRKTVLLNLVSYDAYILIGGSLFQEPEDWKRQWKIFHITVSAFKLFGKKTFVLGCNVGPIKTENYLNTYIRTFRKLTHMTVRDEYSYNLLKDKGIKLSLHPDIVLSKPVEQNINKSENIIGISVIDWPGTNNQHSYVDTNVKLIKTLVENNKIVRMFSFQDTNKISDLKVINQILQGLDEEIKSNVEVVNYQGDIDRFLSLFAQCCAMVTTRFHSLILAMKYQQNIIPVIYSKKTVQTLEYLGLDLKYYQLEDLYVEKIEDIARVLLGQNPEVIEIDNLCRSSEEHFSILDRALRK